MKDANVGVGLDNAIVSTVKLVALPARQRAFIRADVRRFRCP
ncbi:MAG: hypothetical protein ACJ8NS_05800 [Chthoniobacterales bacterium]